MKAINKGAPYMASQQRKVQDVQTQAVQTATNQALEIEKNKQRQQQTTILGGNDKLG